METLASIFGQTSAQYATNHWRRAAGKFRPIRFFVNYGADQICGVLAVESARSSEHLEQHAPERPDVRAAIDGLTARLLGTHVRGGAENDAGICGLHAQRW